MLMLRLSKRKEDSIIFCYSDSNVWWSCDGVWYSMDAEGNAATENTVCEASSYRREGSTRVLVSIAPNSSTVYLKQIIQLDC